MAKNLSLTLSGSGNLAQSLDKVKDAARGAANKLEDVQDAANDIAGSLEAAASSANDLEENLENISQAATAAKKGTSQLDSESRDLVISLEGASVKLDDVASSSLKAGAGATVGADAFDQFEEQSQELRNSLGQLTAAIGAESAAAGASVAPNNAAAKSMDNMGDEAAEARNKMAGAASMAELLSLKSSALSINVGAFTIALRNLTTQVPLLVASLGNLVTAFSAVAAAIGTVGVGGFAVALGGAVAHAEEIAGPMATIEEKMQAMQAIGKEFMSMLREAIQPLVEMEGAANAFISLLEGIATTVRTFSQAIADSYADGPLREAITTLTDAWMDNIVAISDAFSIMVRRMESAGLFEVFADGIGALDDFIIFFTNAMEDMMRISSAVAGNGDLQNFLEELMQVGRQVAGGLAPLINDFLEVVALVAGEISALGSESIGTAVQIVALGVAVSKVVGIVSGIAQPFAIFAGHLGDIVNKSNSVTEAMGRMARRMVLGLSSISGGFASLTQVIQTAMPFLDPDNNNMEEMFDAMGRADGLFGKVKAGFASLASSLTGGVFADATSGVRQLGAELGGNLLNAMNRTTAAAQDDWMMAFSAQQMDELDRATGEWNAFKQRTGGTVRELGNSIKSSVTDMVSTFNQLPGMVAGGINSMTDNIAAGFYRAGFAVDGLGDRLRNIGSLTGWASSIRQRVGDLFQQFGILISGPIESFGESVDKAAARARSAVSDALQPFRDFGSRVLQTGRNARQMGASFLGTLGDVRDSVSQSAGDMRRLIRRTLLFQQIGDGEGATSFIRTNDILGNLRDSVGRTSERIRTRLLGALVDVSNASTDARSALSNRLGTALEGARERARSFGRSMLYAAVVASNGISDMTSAVNSRLAGLSSSFSSAVDSARFFGGALRAATTGIATDSFLEGLQERLGTGIPTLSPDNVMHLGPRTINTEDLQASDIRGVLRANYITPVVDSFRDMKGRAFSAVTDAFSAINSGFGDFASRLAGGPLTSLRGSLFKVGDAFSEFELSTDMTFTGFISGVKSMAASALGAIPGVSLLQERIDEVGDEGKDLGLVNGMFALLRSRVSSSILPTITLGNAFQTLSLRMARSGGIIGLFGEALQSVSAAMKGQITLTRGLKGAYASLVGASAGASAGELAYATASTIASAATSLLTGGISTLLGILSTLALALGGIVVVMAALIAVLGTAAAGLMMLGQSGKDAEGIIEGLKNTLNDIADAVMPLVVASGNAMIDIFNSILYPIKALIDGFKDMAVQLGFMEEGGGASGMDMLASSAEWLADVVAQVGDAFRKASGAVTGAINQMMGALTAFLVDINFGDKVRKYISVLRELYNKALPKIKEALQQYVIKYFNLVKDLIDNLIGSIMNIAGAFSEALNLGGIDFGSIMGALKSFGMFLISLIDPIMNLVGSITAGFKQIYDIVIFVVEGALLYVAKAIGLVVDLVVAFMEGLTGMSAGEMAGGIMDAFGMIASAVGPVINAIAGIIDALVVMTDIAMAILGPVGGALLGVFDVIASVLMPIVRGIGQMFRWVFGNIVSVVTGAIDFIMRYFQTLWDMVQLVLSGNIMGAFKRLGEFIMNSLGGILNFVVSKFKSLGMIIYNAFGAVIDAIINAFLGIPDTLSSMFGQIISGIKNAISGAWNNTIAGFELIPSFEIGGIPNTPFDGISYDGLEIPSIDAGGGGGSDGGGSGSSSGSGGGGGGSSGPGDSNKTEEDLFSGLDTMGGLGNAAKEEATGGSPSQVNYQEGDTMNQYNQDISADPEDKAQLSRIAKDAMEEANSFARRQQGGQ